MNFQGLDSLLNLGATGLVTWLVIYIFKYHLPAQDRKAQERESLIWALVERQETRFDATITELADQNQKQVEHFTSHLRDQGERQIKDSHAVVSSMQAVVNGMEKIADKVGVSVTDQPVSQAEKDSHKL